MDERWSGLLADPVDGSPLRLQEGLLHSQRGGCYAWRDGVADLLGDAALDPAILREMEAFAAMPIANVCYFLPELMARASAAAWWALGPCVEPVSVEIGGGEGYFALALKNDRPGGVACVCDLSRRHLRNASAELLRIRCDARAPYLAPQCAHVAAFWVSLHHFSEEDMALALAQAARVLRPGGVLVLFEPNLDFVPRQILLASPLRRLVYFDSEEKALRLGRLRPRMERLGFREVYSAGHNPPYNPAFLKLLPMGWLFGAATWTFNHLERLAGRGSGCWPRESSEGPRGPRLPLGLGSYFFSLQVLEHADPAHV